MELFKPLRDFGGNDSDSLGSASTFGWRPNDSLWLAYTLGINRKTSNTSWRDLNQLYWSNESR
ncbi:hypothetical protein GIHI108528_07665 [Gillisia hiemivivida]